MQKKKITVSKAYSKNTKEIVKFIKTNHAFKFNIKNFYNTLQSSWYKKKEIGFILRNDKNKIVGFFGVLHAENNIYPNSKYQICNVHTWVVNKEYRGYSTLLLDKVVKIKKIIVSHSTIFKLNKIFKNYNFKLLDKGYFISIFSPHKFKIYLNYKINLLEKNSKYLKIYNDHKLFKYKFLNIEKENCLVIFNVKSKLCINYATILFISDIFYFNKNFDQIKTIIFLNYKCFIFKLDARFVNKKINNPFFWYKEFPLMNKLYKIPDNYNLRSFKESHINNLYSELQY
jgi:hypothetical protein